MSGIIAIASKMLKTQRKAIRLTLHLTIAALTGACLLLGKAEFGGEDSSVFSLLGSPPSLAQEPPAPKLPNPQIFKIQDAWKQVYERLPNLPLENQYVSKETGKVNPNNTLVSRLIRYHVYVKSRPPNYRFDWKLTMADYLGVNEYLVESVYPGYDTLRQNPMESDRAAVQKLTRAQREALVDTLVSVFSVNTNSTATPAPQPSTSTPAKTPSASPPPSAPANGGTPSLPKPGDAQLLLPSK